MRTPGTCSPRGPAGEEGREFIGKRGVWPCTPRCLTRGPATAPRSRLQLPALPARPGPHRLPRRPCGDLAGARFGDGAPAKKATRCSGLRAAQVGGLEEEVVSALPFPRRAQTWGARRAALHPRCKRGAWSETRGETLTGNASESPAPLCPTHRHPLPAPRPSHTQREKYQKGRGGRTAAGGGGWERKERAREDLPEDFRWGAESRARRKMFWRQLQDMREESPSTFPGTGGLEQLNASKILKVIRGIINGRLSGACHLILDFLSYKRYAALPDFSSPLASFFF
ncbi:uncharacterized protein LOC111746230 [Pteropus vampyrus]|uniref:Uncharacterized protein LOC111746230 n=1 Tax=Pteropus vampyrus TaxID=132908 RepID=A0A6P6D043_PTEVA|nr:uncharacterized protein LOC111746230 [Pteropus vampyrus]